MRYLPLFLSFLLLHGSPSNQPQETAVDYKAYSLVIDRFYGDRDYSFVVVADSTSMTGLKGFDFNNPQSYSIDSTWANAIQNSVWKKFLASIQVDESQNQRVERRFMTKPKVKLLSSVKDYFKRESGWVSVREKYEKSYGVIFLSPVIQSADKNLGIFSLSVFQNKESASTMVIFLQKDDNQKWKFVTSITTSMS